MKTFGFKFTCGKGIFDITQQTVVWIGDNPETALMTFLGAGSLDLTGLRMVEIEVLDDGSPVDSPGITGVGS